MSNMIARSNVLTSYWYTHSSLRVSLNNDVNGITEIKRCQKCRLYIVHNIKYHMLIYTCVFQVYKYILDLILHAYFGSNLEISGSDQDFSSVKPLLCHNNG